MIRRMSGYQQLGLLTVLGVVGLATLGGAVRVTDSGLACPDWPLCNGKIVPSGDYHIWLEWTHRLVASLIGLVIAAYVLGAWRRFRDRPWVLWPSLFMVVLLIVQVILGGLTVTEDLSPEIVSAHFGTAMMIVLMLLVSWLSTFAPLRPRAQSAPQMPRAQPATPLPNEARAAQTESGAGVHSVGRWPLRLALASAVSVLVLLLAGSYLASREAGFFCSGEWPLCNGSLWPDGELAHLHMAHRWLAVMASVVLGAWWALSAWRRRADAAMFALASLALVIVGGQVVLGAVTQWTDLAEWSRVLHLTMGILLWTVTVGAASLAVYRSGRVPVLHERRTFALWWNRGASGRTARRETAP